MKVKHIKTGLIVDCVSINEFTPLYDFGSFIVMTIDKKVLLLDGDCNFRVTSEDITNDFVFWE